MAIKDNDTRAALHAELHAAKEAGDISLSEYLTELNLLNRMYDEEQIRALADGIAASLMLAYNNRHIG